MASVIHSVLDFGQTSSSKQNSWTFEVHSSRVIGLHCSLVDFIDKLTIYFYAPWSKLSSLLTFSPIKEIC